VTARLRCNSIEKILAKSDPLKRFGVVNPTKPPVKAPNQAVSAVSVRLAAKVVSCHNFNLIGFSPVDLQASHS
jgi:hypothetical protein